MIIILSRSVVYCNHVYNLFYGQKSTYSFTFRCVL